jgi:hypothetical protein
MRGYSLTSGILGRSGSSIINIITKSGTNELHGSGFLFVRNRNLQALPATAVPGSANPPFDRQQYGGSVGGPLKKDHAWGFFSIENRHQNSFVQTGTRNFTTNTVDVGSASAPLRDVLLTGRVDYKATASDTIFGRYSFNRSKETDRGSLRRPIGSAANRQNSFNRFKPAGLNRPLLIAGGRPFGSGIARAFQFALRYSF